MTLSRVLAVVVAGALVALDAAAPSYAAEPGHPTGTFTLDRTTAHLRVVDGDQNRPYGEEFRITPSNVTDDETAPDDLVMEVSRGDGSGFRPAAFPCPDEGWDCVLTYRQPGTFTPQVRLTDEDANSTTINLPTVRVLRDTTAPVVRLLRPRPRLLHRISAWRVIHGTVVERGVGGVYLTVEVLQKRRGRWYFLQAFDNGTETIQRRWVRGLRTEAATFNRFHPHSGLGYLVGGERWRTQWITGLTRGRLVVRVFATDYNMRETGYPRLASVRLTRR